MSSPSNTPRKERKELSSEIRLVLAFVLMGVVLVGVPWVWSKFGLLPKPIPPVKSAVQNPPATAPKPAAAAAPAPATEPATAAAESGANSGSASAVAAVAETSYTIDTALYHVVFSNKGAHVSSWTLKNVKDNDGKPLELVNRKGDEKAGFPFTYFFRDGEKKPSTDLNTALWVAHPIGADTIEYEFSDGNTTAKKTLAFQQDGYMVQFADEVRTASAGLPHEVQWRGGFGDMAANNAYSHQTSVHYDSTKGKVVTEAAKSAKNGPLAADGSFAFAGIEDQYFVAAFLPPPNTPLRTTTFDDNVASVYEAGDQHYPGIAVGGEARNQLGLYIGPKEANALRKVNPRLADLIDWGWFEILAKPLFLLLQWMTNHFIHNYGWAIILVTILINTVLLPLKIVNLKSMRKMQALQPDMQRINEKYKGIGMSDPRAAQKQQETMDLYKKHGVNPMGGCIPMLIQLPFLYAIYRVLAVTFELRNAPWLWVSDLSQPEHLAIRILPIVMIASSFLMQKMTPMATGGDPNQQKIMQFMPLMWGFFFWSASSGVVLYWLTSNLVQIAQQWFFNKAASPVLIAAPQQKKVTSLKDGRKRT